MAFSHINGALLVYGFVLSYFFHHWTPTGSFPESFVKIRLDLAEILRIRNLDWKWLICLFVCLFVYKLFCFNHRGTPAKSSPENFMMIRLDLKNVYLFFVCLFVYNLFFLIIVGHPQEVFLKDLWRSDLIWLGYIWF